jgi:hypothetical protein
MRNTQHKTHFALEWQGVPSKEPQMMITLTIWSCWFLVFPFQLIVHGVNIGTQ